MASRRMFALTMVDSDAFLDMPTSTRLLYYDLGMRADDDGFVNAPKKICRMTGASEDDLKMLIAKKFIIGFESGVVVVKHWKINNTIRKDCYNETKYIEEKAMLDIDEKGGYSLRYDYVTNLLQDCDGSVVSTETQTRTGKVSKEKNNCSSSEESDCETRRRGSISEVLNDAEWKILDNSYEDLLGLVDLVDLSAKDIYAIKHPLQYVVTVAEKKGWKRKRLW